MTTMRRMLPVLGALLLLGSAAWGQAVDPRFGAFEKPYKQALFQTSQAKADAARAALVAAGEAWRGVLATMDTSPQALAAEAGELTDAELSVEVLGRLALAERLVDQGQLLSAHEALEPIRQRLREYRGARGVWVLNDKLTAFHDTMEAVVLPAVALTGDAPDAQVAAWRSLLPELRARWAAARALVVADPAAERLAPLLDAESAAIERFAAALAGEDRAAMAQTAKAIKPAFAKVFLGVE